MKKFVALLLGSAMLVSAFAGLVACKPDSPSDHTEHVDVDPKDGKCDVCGKDMSETPGPQGHTTHPDANFDGECDVGGEPLTPNDPVPSITLREDPRAADAYTVHEPDGEAVGSYRSLSEAIEAAIENDLDRFEDTQAVTGMKGSYVTLKGSEEKLFRNQRGFSSQRGDVYYYYENGSLIGVEAVDTTVDHALNTEWVNYRVTSGVSATQPQNGVKLLDGKGQVIENPGFSAASREWEFCPFPDASIRATPTRDKGATGSRYTVDLSNVKIAPPYKGVEDKTYAFLGFVVQARQYVFELGIACDTSTGNWYTYCSHSPGQKSQVYNNYDIGELVMGSTWNAEGGYFTPANNSVEFEIMEKRGTDDFGEAVFRNEMTIKTGKKNLSFKIDADFISAVSAGSAVDVKNGFIFVAGLDIVEKGSVVGSDLAIADYTNGSYFKDLAVTKSEIYFPTDEEVEGGEYQDEVDEDRKGKWFSTYTGFGGLQQNVYDYTIVNSAAFVDYEVTAEKSTWSFSYEYEPVTEPFAGKVKEYMQKIGSLKDITSQNVGQYKTVIAELNSAYANGNVDDSPLEAFTYYALDWDTYLEALDVYNRALADTMGPEARQVVEDLQKLPTLGFFKGYRAPDPLPEGAAATDYLYDAVMVVFKGISDRYTALAEDQKEAFGYSAASYIYNEWKDLYDELNAALTGTFGTSEHTVANLKMTAAETLTGAQIIESLFDCAFNVGYTPSNGEKVHVLYGGGSGDYEARASFRILFFREMLRDHEIDLEYLDKIIGLLCEKVDPNAYDGSAFIEDFEGFLYPVMEQMVRILKGDCAWLDQELAEVVNGAMVYHLTFNDPCIRFNMVSGNGNIDGGNFAYYFGETELELNGSTFRKVLDETVYTLIRRDSPETQFSMNGQYQYVASEVTALAEDPYNSLSADCKDVIAALNEFANIADLTTLKANGEAVLTGLTTYEALETKYKALAAKEQEAVARYAFDPAEMFAAYKALKEELGALDDTAQISVKALTAGGSAVAEDVQLTAKGIVEDFIRAALTIDGEQGLLCLAHREHALNTFRTYYLYKLLEEQHIESAFVDRIISYFEEDTTEVGKRFKDLEYFFAVGGQIARIKTKAVRYLDAEMAQVVNTYMANHASANGNGQGTYCLELNWWYGSNSGRFNDACTFAWAHYIADGLYDGTYETWGALMNYLGKILDRDAPASTVMLQSDGSIYSLMTTKEVTALTEDPTANLPQNVQQLIEALEGLADITDLSKVESGAAVLSGLETYAALKTTYDGLDDGSKTSVILMAYDPTELFAAYKALDDQLKALDSTAQITVKALSEDGKTVAESKQMTKAELVKAFISEALMGCSSHSNRHLCIIHDALAVTGFTAYYHYTLIKSNNVECKFVDDIMTMLQSDGWSANVLKDFSDLWAILGQVARIVKGEATYLDAAMAKVINEHMVDRNGAYSDGVNAYNAEWNWDLNGGNGVNDVPTQSRFGWTAYIDDVLYPENQWQSIPSLMEKLAKIVERDGNGVTVVYASNHYGFKVTGPVTGLAEDPTKLSPELTELVNGLNALPDITDLSKVTDGGKVIEGLGTYAALSEKYTALSAEDKANDKAKVDALIAKNVTEILAAYKDLDDQLKALDSTAKLSVKALTATGEISTPAEMTKAEIVKEFIKIAFVKDDKNGFLCLGEREHSVNTFRIYYLSDFITKNEIKVDFVDSIVSLFKSDSGEVGKRWKDLEYFFEVGRQIARIKKGTCTSLDEELATVVNTFMATHGSANSGGTGTYCSELNWWYGSNGGKFNDACTFAWAYYISEDLYSDTYEYQTWGALMDILGKFLDEHAPGVTTKSADGKSYGLNVTQQVTAVTEPQKKD